MWQLDNRANQPREADPVRYPELLLAPGSWSRFENKSQNLGDGRLSSIGGVNSSLLSFQDVHVSLGWRRRPILNELSFDFDGGVLAVLGPNGAGKTTMMRVLAEGTRVSAGRVIFRGMDVSDRGFARELRVSTGYQPQAPRLMGAFSVEEAVKYAAWLKGVSGSRIDDAVALALSRTNLTDLSRDKVRTLSGGQRKRASIAQAIVHEPELVLLDEPTAALDPQERMSLLEVLRNLGDTLNVVFTTHITSDLSGVGAASTVLLLEGGRRRFCGSAGEFGDLGVVEAGSESRWDRAYLKAMQA